MRVSRAPSPRPAAEWAALHPLANCRKEMMLRIVILALALTGAAFACGGGDEPTVGRSTAAGTWTPTPTPAATWTPTPTPEPAATWTPTPTPEPAATWTPTPEPRAAGTWTLPTEPPNRAISLECEFAMRSWNSQPLLALRALEANPNDLTDEERGLWRKYLGGDYAKACAGLWSEPAVDAPNKRNADFEGACYHGLTRAAVEAYRNEWLSDGEYYQREVGDGGGAVWNDTDENPGLLAMHMLGLPYAPAEAWDAAAHSGLLHFLNTLYDGENCRFWYPQIDGDRWYPVIDETPSRNPYGTPYPKPTPTPAGYQRGLITPDEAQIESARELDSQPR